MMLRTINDHYDFQASRRNERYPLLHNPYPLANGNGNWKRLMKNPLSTITEKLPRPTRDQLQKAAKVTAGTAAAIWVVLKLRRELYGPGGTKMSRYDRSVDEVWNERKR